MARKVRVKRIIEQEYLLDVSDYGGWSPEEILKHELDMDVHDALDAFDSVADDAKVIATEIRFTK